MSTHWLALPIVLLSCGTLAEAGEELPPEALAFRSGCLDCHAVQDPVTGPTYREVAERYAGDAQAREVLIEKVKHGGKGNWTKISRGVPMPPHAGRLTDAEVARLVDWVLSLHEEEKP